MTSGFDPGCRVVIVVVVVVIVVVAVAVVVMVVVIVVVVVVFVVLATRGSMNRPYCSQTQSRCRNSKI